jgi:hypothetical protein
MGGTGPDAVGASDDASRRLSFLGRRLPPWVRLHVVVLAPGCTHPFDPGDWRGALIVVERGTIELELRNGRRVSCTQGYVGTLSGLKLRALHNRSDRTAVITGVSRSRHARAQPAPGTDTSTPSSRDSA